MAQLLIVSLSVLTACSDPASNNGDLDAGEDVVSDVDDGDTEQGDAEDAEDTEEDVSACDPACGGDTPLCDEESGECVECFTEAECDDQGDICTSGGRCAACETDDQCSDEVCANTDDDDPATNVCVACLEDGDCTDGVCDTGGNDDSTDNACVGCLDDTHCMDAAASTCDTATDTCVACETNDQCAGIAAGEVCDTSGGDGECVECLVGEEGDCNSGQCDPDTSECVQRQTTPGADTCSECSADADCAPYEYCVPMNFAGSAHGNYCLQLESAGCDQPYSVGETKMSLGGVDALFCTLNESLTTCEALADLIAGAADQCDPSATDLNAECGDPSLGDGLCRKVGVLDNKCTYECSQESECPDLAGKRSCGNANNGDTGPDYCGGGM